MMEFQRVCVLGSTGSIGCSTLDVIARHPEKMNVYALTAHRSMQQLAEQVRVHQPAVVVVPTEQAAAEFLTYVGQGVTKPEVRVGSHALAQTAADTEVTTVMAAIVGAACLEPALAAASAGKRILLANKEALITAGQVFIDAVKAGNAELIPIDSEHSAIYQCLPERIRRDVPSPADSTIRRLLITASGGPFRTWAPELLSAVTPEQACAHPNWSMGKKISVDSATMVNKGLEVIEAHWLFGMPADQIQVLVHPQSMIHSMVEYVDGSILAQLGQPDMRTPIAYGLGCAERIQSGVGLLELASLGRLDFEEPDFLRFPCLKLAFDALRSSQAACITLNAANEVAVEHFLNRKIAYTDIVKVIAESIEKITALPSVVLNSLEAVLHLDQQAREQARSLCAVTV